MYNEGYDQHQVPANLSKPRVIRVVIDDNLSMCARGGDVALKRAVFGRHAEIVAAGRMAALPSAACP